MRIDKRVYYFVRACLNYQKQTNTSLLKFYMYNFVQIPIFIIMIMSIRKISFENIEELTGQGALWFPNLCDQDPYIILPIVSALLNYFNLTVSPFFVHLLDLHSEESQKKQNTGTSTELGLPLRCCSFCIYRLPIVGLLVPSFTGSAPPALYSFSTTSCDRDGSCRRSTPTSSTTTLRCSVSVPRSLTTTTLIVSSPRTTRLSKRARTTRR